MASEDDAKGQGEPEYTFKQEAVLTNLDPELQRVVLALRQGLAPPPHLIEEVELDGETKKVVDVVARLRNPARKVPGLWVVQVVGRVVTGMVEADKVADVRANRNVLSLKAARRLRQTLADSVPEINATPEQQSEVLPAGHPTLDGSGVIVGFVDHGCDFSHPNFRRRDAPGSTRVLFLWDQRGGKTDLSPKCYGYGREFTAKMIDAKLEEFRPSPDDPDRPHRELGYVIKSGDHVFGHGTEVMDAGVGNGGGQFAPGVAPGADIIFVDASLGSFEDSEQSFGNSRHLLEAVKYIFDKADELNRADGVKRPVVVNISLNFDGGPHDGSTPVEEFFDSLLETPGRAIVIAAGNSRLAPRHVRRTIRPGHTRTLFWRIDENDRTTNKLEIWYDGRHKLAVTLRSPGGQTLGPFSPDTTHTIYAGEKEPVAWVFNRLRDPANRDNQIALLFGPAVAGGLWQVDLRDVARSPRVPFDLHAWIEKDEDEAGKPSIFEDRDGRNDNEPDASFTIGTIACGVSTIAVGAYEKVSPKRNLIGSAEGPTRDGKLKPEVSAPGAGRPNAAPMFVAKALTSSVGETDGGTSLAAPHVAGAVALLMEAALKDQGRLLANEETRRLIIAAARKDPPPGRHAWDSCHGAGRVDAAGSLKGLLESVGQDFQVLTEQREFVAEVEVFASPDGRAPETLPSATRGEVVTSVAVASEVLTTVAVLDGAAEASAPPATNGGGDGVPDLPPTKGH